MIRKMTMLAAVAAALAVAPAALAQQKEPVKVGLGLGLNVNQIIQPATMNWSGVPPVAVYVPIQITPHLRVEPWLGFWTYSQNDYAGRVTDLSRYAWDLGLGAVYYFQPASPLGLYVGGRLGLTFSGGDVDPGVSVTETDFRIQAVSGAEYFVASKFSIGAELQLGVTFYGDPSTKTALTGVTVTPSRGMSSWQTNGVIFFRYFL